MGNMEHVKDIANTLEQIHNGLICRCYECGKMFKWDQVKHDDESDIEICPDCGSECPQMSIYDYFNDDEIYNIEYRAPSKHDDINSVSVMIACGGPNIYIDTADCKVKLYHWGNYAECDISTGCADEITAYFNELWNCE